MLKDAKYEIACYVDANDGDDVKKDIAYVYIFGGIAVCWFLKL